MTPQQYEIVQPPMRLVDHDAATGQVVPGYRVVARDLQTGAVAHVFMPETHYSPENVHQQVVHQLRLHNEVMQLGGTTPAPAG